MKKKCFLILFCIMITGTVSAQNVGINTTSPLVTLDVRAKNDTGTTQGAVTTTDGVLVPRVSDLVIRYCRRATRLFINRYSHPS